MAARETKSTGDNYIPEFVKVLKRFSFAFMIIVGCNVFAFVPASVFSLAGHPLTEMPGESLSIFAKV
jgi:hypothetical protein